MKELVGEILVTFYRSCLGFSRCEFLNLNNSEVIRKHESAAAIKCE